MSAFARTVETVQGINRLFFPCGASRGQLQLQISGNPASDGAAGNHLDRRRPLKAGSARRSEPPPAGGTDARIAAAPSLQDGPLERDLPSDAWSLGGRG